MSPKPLLYLQMGGKQMVFSTKSKMVVLIMDLIFFFHLQFLLLAIIISLLRYFKVVFFILN